MSTEGTAATTPSTTPADGGRGRGRGRGDGRGRGYLGRNPRGGRGANVTVASDFKGHTKEMNGHVFECFHEGAKQNQFTKTIEALGEYIAKNMKNPGDLMSLTKELKAPEVPLPKKLTTEEAADALTAALWKEEVTEYSKRKGMVKQNLKALFTVIWGQCSESMRDKLKSIAEYKEKDNEADCEWLLVNIKGVMLRFEGQRDIFLSIDDAEQNLVSFRQNDLSLPEYKAQYENLLQVLEYYAGGTIAIYPSLVQAIPGKAADAKKMEVARNRRIAMAFLKRADRRRFGTLWNDLENQNSRNNNQYPADLTAAYSLLVNYQPPYVPPRARDSGRPPPSSIDAGTLETPSELSGTVLQQSGSTGPIGGTDGTIYAGVTCFGCTNRKGHYANQCPKDSVTGEQH